MVSGRIWYVFWLFLKFDGANVVQNVHEGPMGIGTRVQYAEVSLSAGNVISDGQYKSPWLSKYILTDYYHQ